MEGEDFHVVGRILDPSILWRWRDWVEGPWIVLLEGVSWVKLLYFLGVKCSKDFFEKEWRWRVLFFKELSSVDLFLW